MAEDQAGATPEQSQLPVEPQRLSNSAAEELSFRLFDGQSLQYTDRACNGLYDVWGRFQGTEDNTPAAKFPSLATLSEISYDKESIREIVVYDRSNDERLDALFQEAKDIIEANRQHGPLVCAEALAKIVASAMGGPQVHRELVEMYKTCSAELSEKKQSAVRYIGELEVGLSRHRCLLLKVLADSVDLPCRLVRGHFYLGGAGASGENSVAVVQFNRQEWMIELVSQPGRMYQVKKGSIPQMSTEALWGQARAFPSGAAAEKSTTPSQSKKASSSAYPTMPSQEGEEPQQSRSSSSSPDEGLQWDANDGEPMDDLQNKGDGERRESMDKQKSSASLDRDSQSAAVDENLLELTNRLRLQRSRSGSEELTEGASSSLHAEQSAGQATSQHRERALPFGRDFGWHAGEQKGVPQAQTDSQRGSFDSGESQGWREWREGEVGDVVLDLPEAGLPDRLEVGRYGSSPSGGPARARVRGTDQSGRVVEFELEGVTLTSAHNMGFRSRVSAQNARQSEDIPRKTLDAMISRYRVLDNQPSPSTRNNGSKDAVRENSLGSDQLRLRVSSLALEPVRTGARQERGGSMSRSRASQFSPSWSDPSDPRSSVAHSSIPEDHEGGRSEEVKAGMIGNKINQDPYSLHSSTDTQDSSQGHAQPAHMASKQSLAARIRSIDNESFAGPGKRRDAAESGASPQYSTSTSARPANESTSEQDLFGQGSNSQPSQGSQVSTVSRGMFGGTSEEDVEVDFSEVQMGPRIGVGCFGEVFKARWRQTTVAVKRLFDQSLTDHSLKEFKAEVMLNRRLKHPNVVLFMGACTEPPNLSIITQWAPRGSLFQILHSTSPDRLRLNLRQKLRMAVDIARGMHYLHSAKPPIIHRDLKSMNLLVENDLTIKVCDFGLARTRSTTWVTGGSQGGTPEWTAPEVLRSMSYNEKSDVYSFGVVLYELATELEPWGEITPMQVIGVVGWANQRLKPPKDCPKIFADLMNRCFEAPELRPSFEEAMQILLDYAHETKPAATKDK